MNRQILVLLAAAGLCGPTRAQSVLFDFDTAPAHSPLPIDLTVGGITAHFVRHRTGVLDPAGRHPGLHARRFRRQLHLPQQRVRGRPPDRLLETVTDFSILYAPRGTGLRFVGDEAGNRLHERVVRGNETMIADPPGTWPTATLGFSSISGFNNVVVHYDQRPPTGGDWGPIFMADNMNVTSAPFVPPPGDYDANGIVEPADYVVWQNAFGTNMSPGTGADGNGNGVVDAADYTVWRDHLGAVAGAAGAVDRRRP